jgi:hypothetical protein
VTSFEIPLTLRVVNWVRRQSSGVALGACVLAVAGAIALSACGGGGSSNGSGDASTTAAGQAGSTGATGATSAGPTGPTGATTKGSKRGRGKRKSQSGGSSSGGSSSGGSKGSAGNTAGGTNTGSAPARFGTLEEKELYREAKIVCGALTMPGLAHEYEVKSTPESVARAYAKGYAPNLRGAVYLGCKAAFTKK